MDLGADVREMRLIRCGREADHPKTATEFEW